MTKLRKIALVALIAILSTSMLFAQGSKEEAKADGPVTIKVLNYLDMAQANSANEVTEVWDKFSAEHPEIIVEREDLFNEPFHQKTESYIAADNVPDVVYMWPSGRSTSLITTGAVQDLTPWLERDGLLDMYNPAALAQGDIIAELPNGTTSSHLMIANLAVLEKYGLDMPKTLQDLIDMVPVLAKDNVQVIAMDNMDSWVMQSCLFSAIAGRYGNVDWFDKVDAGELKFTDDWFVNALEVINTLYNEGVISRASLNSPYTQSRGDFVNGKAAFYIDGDWSTGGFITDPTTGKALIDPAKQATDYAFMLFPEVPGEVIHNSSSGVIGTGFGLSSKLEMGTPEAEAAWTLIKYLQGEDVQKYRLSTGASFPSYLGIDVDAFMAENNLDPFIGMRYDFYSIIEHTTPVCDGVLAADVHNFINTGLQEIGLGSKTPAQVAAEVQQAWEDWKAMN